MDLLAKRGSIIVFLILFIFPLTIFATAQIRPRLVLKQISQVSAQESHDEIYFAISDSKAKNKVFYTVPGHLPYFSRNKLPQPSGRDFIRPYLHWKTKHLDKVKNVILWNQPLKPNESRQLMISLIESDTPPWDLEDILGSIKIKLVNQNNNLKIQLIPLKHAKISKIQAFAQSKEYRIDFKNHGAHYQVVIGLYTGN